MHAVKGSILFIQYCILYKHGMASVLGNNVFQIPDGQIQQMPEAPISPDGAVAVQAEAFQSTQPFFDAYPATSGSAGKGSISISSSIGNDSSTGSSSPPPVSTVIVKVTVTPPPVARATVTKYVTVTQTHSE